MTSYSASTIWLLICVIGTGTFLIRFSLIALSDRADRIPASAQRALRFIPPAVLAALVAPSFLMPAGTLEVTNLRLVAGLVAALVSWTTRSVLWTIVSGMGTLWILQTLT